MALEIHKDIVRVVAIETINAIIRDLGNALFSISVDESLDHKCYYQRSWKWISYLVMWIKKVHVIERFINVEHVSSTTALSLKAPIDGNALFFYQPFGHVPTV